MSQPLLILLLSIGILLILYIIVFLCLDNPRLVINDTFIAVPIEQNTSSITMFEIDQDVNTKPIPKIIHQTAMADRSKWHPIWERCQASWRKHFPDWTYIMWDDDDLDRFMHDNYPDYYNIYVSLDANIKRIDIARYFILYAMGGMYVDMDYMCYMNFEHLLPRGHVSIAESMWTHVETFQNALMASPPRHPFWIKVIEMIRKDAPVLECAGPQVIDRAVKFVHINRLPRAQFSVVRPEDIIGNSNKTIDAVESNLIRRPNSERPIIYASHQSTVSWLR